MGFSLPTRNGLAKHANRNNKGAARERAKTLRCWRRRSLGRPPMPKAIWDHILPANCSLPSSLTASPRATPGKADCLAVLTMALATPAFDDRFVRTNGALPARDTSRPVTGRTNPSAPPERLQRPRDIITTLCRAYRRSIDTRVCWGPSVGQECRETCQSMPGACGPTIAGR